MTEDGSILIDSKPIISDNTFFLKAHLKKQSILFDLSTKAHKKYTGKLETVQQGLIRKAFDNLAQVYNSLNSETLLLESDQNSMRLKIFAKFGVKNQHVCTLPLNPVPVSLEVDILQELKNQCFLKKKAMSQDRVNEVLGILLQQMMIMKKQLKELKRQNQSYRKMFSQKIPIHQRQTIDMDINQQENNYKIILQPTQNQIKIEPSNSKQNKIDIQDIEKYVSFIIPEQTHRTNEVKTQQFNSASDCSQPKQERQKANDSDDRFFDFIRMRINRMRTN